MKLRVVKPLVQGHIIKKKKKQHSEKILVIFTVDYVILKLKDVYSFEGRL